MLGFLVLGCMKLGHLARFHATGSVKSAFVLR